MLTEQMTEQEMLVMDGFDNCILGVCSRFGQEDVIAYDLSKVLGELMNQGMDEEEANEFFEFNMLGSFVGDKTPCFIELNEETEIDSKQPKKKKSNEINAI